jgi:hypothetical protein
MGMAEIAIAALVIGAGTAAYGMATAPGAPKTQTPPPPPNSVQYGDDGGVLSSQTYDAATNTWITKGRELTDAQKAEKAKLGELRTKMVDNLNTTPEDRVKAYNEYRDTYAANAHSVTDPAFDRLNRNSDEQANSTGMYGSRAYADTKGLLAQDKLTQDANIADQATMAKEQLASNDRSFYANMLNQIDSGARSDTLAQNEIANGQSNAASQKYAGTLGQYQAMNSSILAQNQAEQARSASYVSAGSNMAGGLMYLYGGKSGGVGGGSSSSLAPTGSGVQKYGQNFSLR